MANEHLPFHLPVELCEIIFNRLRAKDLLNCILVSGAWHDFVLRSKAFEKVALTVNVELNLEDVMKSNRKYANFILLNINRERLEQSLTIFNSAKKIEVVGGDGWSAKEDRRHRLPGLHELTLSNVCDDIFEPFMTFQDNLKILNVHNLKLSPRGQPSISTFLELNKNLSELNLYLTEHGNIFQHDIASGFQNSLESVTISFRSNFEIDARTLANIEKFLISQGDTLKVICLINAASLSLIHRVWNALKRIERLYFFSADPFLDYGETSHVELRNKDRLKAMEIHVLGPVQIGLHELQPILGATKQLESLGVWNLSEDLVEYAAMNLLKLKNLFCATSDKDCESFYEQLKSKSGINSMIKLHQYL